MALPAAGYFNSPLRTVGEMKQALDDQRGFVAEHATRFGGTASSAYAVSVSEGSSWLLCNGTFPVTLPSAGSAGSNWCYGIINGGAGVITVKPQAGQAIDGVSSATGIPLRAGEVMQVVCTGSGYYRISHHQSQGMTQQAAYWTTPGTYSWTKRAGITVICWFLQAPGGGGAAQLYPSSGGGGGGGEYREGWSIVPIAETTYTITLGSPGSGGTTSGVAGGNGGTTSISGIASAIGGQGGTSGGGGGAGGSGGSGGQLVLPGQPGVAAAFGSGGPGGGNGRGGGAGQQSSNTAGSGTAGVDGGGGAGGNVGQAGQAGGGPSVGILC